MHEKSDFEKNIQCLIETFHFSREEIKNNSGLCNAVCHFSCEELLDNTKFFMDLLCSKENFFSAMSPSFNSFYSYKFDYSKEFLGIMSYKRKHIFIDKLNSLSNILSLTQEETAKIFVSDWSYIYHSSQTTRKIITRWSSTLNITTKQLGNILKKHPCFLAYSNTQLEEFIQNLKESFSISEKEAINIILSRPNIVTAPIYSVADILSDANEDFSLTVLKKPWLYQIHEGILKHHKGYDYGNYDAILKFFEHIENTIGEIVDVEFENLNPRIRDGERNIHFNSKSFNSRVKDKTRNKIKTTYTILIVKKRHTENDYCFVSFGSGYNTCNRYYDPDKRLLRAIYGEQYKQQGLAEFIVDAPPIDSKEYREMLWFVFLMASTGNIIPCDCALKNGKSIVVDKLESHFGKFEYDDISCIFRTLNVIPTSEIEKYRNKYKKHFPQKFDDDFEDLNDFDDDYEEKEYVFEEEDE